MKGKIVKIEPLMNENVHDTWTNQSGKTYYKQHLTIEVDGKEIEGSCLTANEYAPYGPKEEVEFEMKTNQYGNSFKGIKKLNTVGKNGANMKNIGRQRSMTAAFNYHALCNANNIESNSEKVKIIMDAIEEFVLQDEDYNGVWSRIGAIDNTLLQMEVGLKISKDEIQLIDNAKSLLKYVER